MSEVLGLAPLDKVTSLRLEGSRATSGEEMLAVEVPVALRYNGLAYAVMMVTPADLEDFVVGFSLTEGVVDAAHEIGEIHITPAAGGLVVDIHILAARAHTLRTRRQQLTGNSSCGLCGVESLQAALRPVTPIAARTPLAMARIHAALAALKQAQTLNQACGGLHAAGILTGDALLAREDIGRHNAVDKVIGACASQRRRGVLLVSSSRASYEIVLKTASAGIEILAAISAPSALAVSLATEAGLTLIGFAREQRATVYSHPERVTDADDAGPSTP